MSAQGFCHLRKVNLAPGWCPFSSPQHFARFDQRVQLNQAAARGSLHSSVPAALLQLRQCGWVLQQFRRKEMEQLNFTDTQEATGCTFGNTGEAEGCSIPPGTSCRGLWWVPMPWWSYPKSMFKAPPSFCGVSCKADGRKCAKKKADMEQALHPLVPEVALAINHHHYSNLVLHILLTRSPFMTWKCLFMKSVRA